LVALKDPPIIKISKDKNFVKIKIKPLITVKAKEIIFYGAKNRIFIDHETANELKGPLAVYESAVSEEKISSATKHYTTINELIDEINRKASKYISLSIEEGRVVCNFVNGYLVEFSPQIAAILGFRNHSVQ